jgi:hypothetical protein
MIEATVRFLNDLTGYTAGIDPNCRRGLQGKREKSYDNFQSKTSRIDIV